MINKLTKNIGAYLPLIFLLFIIGDFFTNIFVKNFENNFRRYSGVIKLFFEFIMILIIISNSKKISKNIIVLSATTFFFIIGQYLLSDITNYNIKNEFFSGNIYYFNRYLYILLFIIFINSISIKNDYFKKTYRLFEIILIINSIIILIGFIFHIELFRSYEYSLRFGYSGLFSKPGETSYLYMIAICVNFYLWLTKNISKYLYKVLFFIIISFFLGQKKILFFITTVILYYLFFIYKNKKQIILTIMVLLSMFFLFKTSIINIIFKYLPFWERIYKKDGMLSVITSYRNVLLEKAIIYLDNNWTILNYFFGSIELVKYKTEFELIDIFLLSGIFGIIFYVYVIYYHFFKKANTLKKILVFLFFLTSFISGGLFLNVTAILMLYIAMNYIMVE